jgi:hypothetical protein
MRGWHRKKSCRIHEKSNVLRDGALTILIDFIRMCLYIMIIIRIIVKLKANITFYTKMTTTKNLLT